MPIMFGEFVNVQEKKNVKWTFWKVLENQNSLNFENFLEITKRSREKHSGERFWNVLENSFIEEV